MCNARIIGELPVSLALILIFMVDLGANNAIHFGGNGSLTGLRGTRSPRALDVLDVHLGIALEVIKPSPRHRQILEGAGTESALPEPMGGSGGKYEQMFDS